MVFVFIVRLLKHNATRIALFDLAVRWCSFEFDTGLENLGCRFKSATI